MTLEHMHQHIQNNVQAILEEWENVNDIHPNDILVIGCSTSEVAGSEIGTSGSEEIAAVLFATLKQWSEKTNVHLAFQCCEHLNRALVIESNIQQAFHLEKVSVVPTPSAGGSMAAFAYQNLANATVVESIKADLGLDIGDTLIGMHLKHVAVPVRLQQKTIGQARANVARTRPKLIGGARAQYE